MAYKKKEEVQRIPFNPSYPPSPEQEKIFEAIKERDDNLHCSAVAGSGKTTTAVWAMSLNKKEPAAMLAFNKDIVTDIEPRCPTNVTVKTAHSFGYAATAKARGRLFVNGNKVIGILKAYPLFNPDGVAPNQKCKVLSRMYETSNLIDKLRVTLTDENDSEAVKNLALDYNIDIDKMDDILELLPEIFNKMINSGNAIDFTDMLWLPIRLGLDIPSFPMIYVDEVQDFNNLMITYVNKMTSDRIMTVGDERQAIYGFAGANSNSIGHLVDTFKSERLPLNTCYRCGKSIIELAKQIVPHIEAYSGNPDGEVRKLEDIDYTMEDGSMILSRRNANLIRPYFQLIKEGRKAYIKGRNIGDNIISLIAKMKAKDMSELLDKLDEYTEQNILKQQARKVPSQSAIELLVDQQECIKMIADDCFSIEQMNTKIKEIFSESGSGVVLSSIHKSKGLEADHVTIIDYSRVRISNEKMTDEDHKQEANLNYVSLTRAKLKLDLVG